MERLEFKSLTSEGIFQSVLENPHFREKTQEQVDETLARMLDLEYIFTSVNSEGETLYTLVNNFARDRTHLRLKMQTIHNELQQAIIHYLLKITNRFWSIILDAQKTKTSQMIRVIREFLSSALDDPDSGRIVPVMFLMNSLELKDQAIVRFIGDIIRQYDAHLFVFSSGTSSIAKGDPLADRVTMNPAHDHIEVRIQEYAEGRSTRMPIVITLPNKTQLAKVKRGVYDTVRNLQAASRNISHSTFVDEADAVYPQIRSSMKSYFFTEEGSTPTPTPDNSGIYFTTASHEDFINAYPEVQISQQIGIVLDEGVDENHRSLNHPDAIYPVPNLLQKPKESDGEFTRRVVGDNWKTHFAQKVKGMNRKVIVCADFENAKQKELARFFAVTYGTPSIVVKQGGFTIVWRTETGVNERSVKTNCKEFIGKSINEKLLYLYQQNPELQIGTLLVIGHNKLDRALTYHSAPRDPTNPNALIFTDIIAGYIRNRNRAIQVVGRLYGVIAQHPSYCGNLWFWVDQRTKECVLRNSRLHAEIQKASFIPRFIADLQAQAASRTPDIITHIARDIRQVGPFTLEDVWRVGSERLGKSVHTSAFLSMSDKYKNNAGGYDLCTRLTPHWSNIEEGGPVGKRIETYTHLNRIVLNRQTDCAYPHTLAQVPMTVSVKTYRGDPTEQNFVVIPVYDDETVPSTVVPKYYLRYEEPVRDSEGSVIFVGRRVTYNGRISAIKSVEVSLYGVPSKVTLDDSEGTVVNSSEVKLLSI